ncbi:hypothetical protein C0991_010638 [Blastosporella zonata]|nr:hypothetical protein C0991_010638 [Blastosporella zonata]
MLLPVRSVLCDVSRMLETLLEVAGIQSFVLAVDPVSPSDKGFLGGTVVGREFWRGLRGGGDAGAKGFKAHCVRDLESSNPPIPRQDPPATIPPAQPKLPPARSLKTELYDGVRKALRTVSGVRNAEMKWTNHERLDVYGVRLIGWPAGIPVANPSSLKASQNKAILNCLDNGTLMFEKLFPDVAIASVPPNDQDAQESEDIDDFSWAYDANAGDPPIDPIQQVERPVVSKSAKIQDDPWQAPEDLSFSSDSWPPDLDNDMASILQSTLDGSNFSRKRPRSESDLDDT